MIAADVGEPSQCSRPAQGVAEGVRPGGRGGTIDATIRRSLIACEHYGSLI
ncbi:hypothetical protein ALMP_55780 [Streptomyces sp. A012304]|nr:hypothetical protein ALMP_55780 [Streptomyces sp. A012304]